MKLIKINPDHFIVVNDFYESKSDIKQEDVNSFFYHKEEGVVFVDRIVNVSLICDNIKTEFFYASLRKITHSTKELEDVKILSLSEVKEVIGEVDVEKLAEEYIGDKISDPFDPLKRLLIAGYIDGYNRALKDHKYTEEDLRKAVDMARDIADDSAHDTFTVDDIKGCTEICTYGWREKYSNEKIIQHIQSKTQWDVEFVDGKIKLI
jgi:hypothetical protein